MIRRNKNIKNEPNKKKKKLNENKEKRARPHPTGEQTELKKKRFNSKTINNGTKIDELDEQSPDIYKLPVELMMEIFNLLPIADLNSVSLTSKWWQKVAHACFRQNYSFISGCYKNKLWNKLHGAFDAFKQLIHRVTFFSESDFEFFLNTKVMFHQLSEIRLISMNLTHIKIECMIPHFNRLKRLEMKHCEILPNLIDRIFDLSPSLKYCVFDNDQIDIDTEWFLRNYPMIDRFGVTSKNVLPIAKFLELNPNIRSFEMNSGNLWENRDSLKGSKVALDNLAIVIDENHRETTMLASICHLLNELVELGIYKRLELYVRRAMKQEMVDEFVALNALVKLYTCDYSGVYLDRDISCALSTLRKIEELHVERSSDLNDIEAMASSLVNLKKLEIWQANFQSILPFISRAANMEIIKISDLTEHEVINLAALNRQRSKLPNAKKITLYVVDSVFLAVTRRSRDIDLDYIKLQRKETIEWDHAFGETFD